MTHLRLIKPGAEPFAYTNRMGDTYYLHAGVTKTGKHRYWMARLIGDGALPEVPEGFEVTESMRGTVSVRRKLRPDQTASELELGIVQAALARHRHLEGCVARGVGTAVVVFAPAPGARAMQEFTRSALGIAALPPLRGEQANLRSYEPVMKFARAGDAYTAHRMTYRGEGGWSWPLASGALDALARRFVKSIGTDAFFELM